MARRLSAGKYIALILSGFEQKAMWHEMATRNLFDLRCRPRFFSAGRFRFLKHSEPANAGQLVHSITGHPRLSV
jgi:hypothetical protein